MMEVAQVRLPKEIMKQMDMLVNTGIYSNRSDVMRDAIRKLAMMTMVEEQIGSIPNTGDSVKEVREIRKKLSKEIKSWEDVDKINKLYQ